MNILMLLTPKKDVSFLTTNLPIAEALTILKVVRYSSVPLLDKDGYYVGTITEGDLLWYLEENGLEFASTSKLRSVKRIRNYAPVTINASMEDLVTTSLGQNFIPILDDRNYFIGIVTRKDLLTDFINKFAKKAEVVKENPILNALYKRRSIRKFKKEKIHPKVIDEILKVTLISPSAGNRRPQHVIHVDDQKLIRELGKIHPKGGQYEKAPHLILILNDNEVEDNEYNANSNSSALLLSMLLAIDSFENLGGFWIATRDKNENEKLLKALNVPLNYSLHGMIAFGVKNEFKGANEAIAIEKIHKNKW